MKWQIWKDYTINLSAYLGSNQFVDYSIKQGANTIYSGRAYAIDGACKVTINEVCADYLGASLPTLTNAAYTQQAFGKAFDVIVNGNTIDTVTFLNDWSYDYGRDLATKILSCPIRAEFLNGAPVLVSADGQDASISGTLDAVSYTILTSNKAGVACLTPSGNNSVTLGGITFVKACGEAALYYVNAYGGWDFLVMRSAINTTDAVSRKTYGKTYDNTAPSGRGRVNYRSEIDRTYVLRTGTLTDEQSALMPHLLESPLVYLWLGGQMHPVILDGGCEHKTFHNQGHKRVDYTITAILASNIERR